MPVSNAGGDPPKENNMYIDHKMLAVALGSLLVGGGAVAAYRSLPSTPVTPVTEAMVSTPPAVLNAGSAVAPLDLAAGPDAVFAPIVSVKPVTSKQVRYATVLDVEPVSHAVAQQVPRQACRDVPVTQRLPERDGNVGGTVAGAIIGGLLGNRIGGGDGRRVATVAGAAAGGYIGHRVDRRHVGGRVVQATERQCQTVIDTVNSAKVIGYDVTFRNPDGTTGMKRMSSKPGSRISLGSATTTIGYDVTYKLDGEAHVVRMDERPRVERFRVVDGQVVTQG